MSSTAWAAGMICVDWKATTRTSFVERPIALRKSQGATTPFVPWSIMPSDGLSVERLEAYDILGTATLCLTGNAYANLIYGNDGSNRILRTVRAYERRRMPVDTSTGPVRGVRARSRVHTRRRCARPLRCRYTSTPAHFVLSSRKCRWPDRPLPSAPRRVAIPLPTRAPKPRSGPVPARQRGRARHLGGRAARGRPGRLPPPDRLP